LTANAWLIGRDVGNFSGAPRILVQLDQFRDAQLAHNSSCTTAVATAVPPSPPFLTLGVEQLLVGRLVGGGRYGARRSEARRVERAADLGDLAPLSARRQAVPGWGRPMWKTSWRNHEQ